MGFAFWMCMGAEFEIPQADGRPFVRSLLQLQSGFDEI
jgi:hypothetical protein